MPLTDAAIRSAKPGKKVIKLFDGGGLYVEIAPSGGKWWRLKYRFQGKEKRISLGTYPGIGLKDARERREQAKKLLANGVDPSAQRKESKAAAEALHKEQAATFEAVARDWYAKKCTAMTEGHQKKILSRLENQLFPYIGAIPLSSLEPADILAAVQHALDRNAIETAHRLVQLSGQVCRYARLVGHTKYNAASELSKALPTVQVEHRAAIINPVELGHLLRAIDEYNGCISTRYALRIMPYVFVRSNELRCAKWEEIDFNRAEWVIPAKRMKMKKGHTVPLAHQVVRLFKELHQFSGEKELVFPGPSSATRCISNMTLLTALRRMGYIKGKMTVHGFRGTASTLLNEQGYRADVIEAQLAHGERDAVRKAYNHAKYLEERHKMMQKWADYLDELRGI